MSPLPHYTCYPALTVFFILAILVDVTPYLMVLIFIPLISKGIEHHFMWMSATSLSFLEDVYSDPLLVFKNRVIVLLLSFAF